MHIHFDHEQVECALAVSSYNERPITVYAVSHSTRFLVMDYAVLRCLGLYLLAS